MYPLTAIVTSELQVGALISGVAFLALTSHGTPEGAYEGSLLFLVLLLVLLCYHHSR